MAASSNIWKLSEFSSFLAQRRFDQPVRLLSRKKYLSRIIHSERRQVHKVKMLIRQRKMNFVYAVKGAQDRFAHGVQRMLKRFAVVLGKRFEQRLSHAMPNRAEFDFLSFVHPFCSDGRRKDSISILFQSGVRISQKSVEFGFRRLQHI